MPQLGASTTGKFWKNAAWGLERGRNGGCDEGLRPAENAGFQEVLIMRMPTIVSFAVAVLALACGGFENDPPTSGQTVKGTDPAAPGDGKSAGGGAATGGKGGATGDADGGTKGGGDAPEDPACAASCASTMVAKCGGDPTICDVVCSLTAAEVACLEAAPTCDKAEWVRCEAVDSGDAGASKGGSK